MADESSDLKQRAAESAVAQVENGMIVGLGSGSTADFVLLALGRRIRAGLQIDGIPASERTAARARELGIPLAELDRRVDLAIDGADEVERSTLNLVKGRGGALLREKIIAQAAARYLIVIDPTKLVEKLGAGPVPVEVVPFGWQTTARDIEKLGGKSEKRDFVTDNGNYILDCHFGLIEEPQRLSGDLQRIAGVMEHGLFLGLTSEVHVGMPDGVTILKPNL